MVGSGSGGDQWWPVGDHPSRRRHLHHCCCWCWVLLLILVFGVWRNSFSSFFTIGENRAIPPILGSWNCD